MKYCKTVANNRVIHSPMVDKEILANSCEVGKNAQRNRLISRKNILCKNDYSTNEPVSSIDASMNSTQWKYCGFSNTSILVLQSEDKCVFSKRITIFKIS